MKEIIVSTQKELDSLPDKFQEYTRIIIKCDKKIIITKNRGNSTAELWGNSTAELWENSTATLRENSTATLWGNSTATLRENSTAKLRENSTAELRGNSTATLRENSIATLRENSTATLRGNSTAELWENSTATAYNNAGIHLQSDFSTITLFAYAVCWALAQGKIIKKSKTCKVIIPKIIKGLTGWFNREAVKEAKEIILYKRVSKDYKTQEGYSWETTWTIGTTLTHPNWKPNQNECGEGKYHACSRPYFCDEFRDKQEDKYIAILIKKADLFIWEDNPRYPHKIAFRSGKVLYEVNKFGKEIK